MAFHMQTEPIVKADRIIAIKIILLMYCLPDNPLKNEDVML
jgi:hypothetical protein